ncbi:MAG: hypothetical protein Q7J35_08445 [Candidatus Methanoperedens sp.]|nr:hypothetical protein [Candidatus Methanoperedens sp.]
MNDVFLRPICPQTATKRRVPTLALIENIAFYHVCALRGDGLGLASACTCEDQIGGVRQGWGESEKVFFLDQKYFCSFPIITICEAADERGWTQMDHDSTRIALMTRMHTDTKSTHIQVLA